MAGFPERRTRLRDGTPVLVRAARPDDAALVRLGFAQLSDRSRQFRFLRAKPRLLDDDLAFLAAADGALALGALDLSRDPPEPVGLARYVLLPARPEAAEVAITVIDSHQGRGLGTLLFGCLAAAAASAGLACFMAFVHPRNRAMRALLDDLGATAETGDAAGDAAGIEYRLPLRADPAEYPDTPAGAAFRAAHALMRAGNRAA